MMHSASRTLSPFQFQLDAKHAVGRRVLRSHVDLQLAGIQDSGFKHFDSCYRTFLICRCF